MGIMKCKLMIVAELQNLNIVCGEVYGMHGKFHLRLYGN
jgi:hypothetical protein